MITSQDFSALALAIILIGSLAPSARSEPAAKADYSAFVYAADQLAPPPGSDAQSGQVTSLTTDATGFEARGVLRAAQTSEIGASMSGKLIKVPYKPGQSFNKGALLAQFDCNRQRAEADAIDHALTALSVKHDNVKELEALGAAGTLEVSMAAADVDRAQADLRVAKAALKYCSVYAPYAGMIKARHVSAYDTPPPGAPLFSIIRTGALEIDLITPSAWMRWMRPGDTFDFEIDETGKTYSAKIIRFGAAVDPVSQTLDVTAKFTSRAPALPGMSGVARFNRQVAKAPQP